jgi:hypothetical protein
MPHCLQFIQAPATSLCIKKLPNVQLLVNVDLDLAASDRGASKGTGEFPALDDGAVLVSHEGRGM